MAQQTRQKQQFDRGANPTISNENVTRGVVVDTNDPQQNGRLRIVCIKWGDTFSTPVEDIPWASYVSPFGGQTSNGTKGPGLNETNGGLSYGIWAIPKVGATAVVMCLDGDPAIRIWLGCMYDMGTPHTMPHGRFAYDDHPGIEDTSPIHPHGPLSSTETPISPLSENLKRAFGNKSDPNYEWRSRAADYSVASVAVENLSYTFSNVADDKNVAYDNWHSTQGYGINRVDPHAASSFTDRNYDSTVYAFTSPGFHSMSMDDRQENCRMRFRTTSGHQILLDDTNERIYVATAKGNNWIEMDQDGNIDAYTSRNLSAHAEGDINLTSDQTIRMYAADSIHMFAGNEIRMESQHDTHIRSGQNIRTHAAQSIFIQSDQSFNISAGQSLYMSAVADANLRSGSSLKLTGGSSTNIASAGNINNTANTINLNGAPAEIAQNATSPNDQKAFWTNRVPLHEPYARTMTKDDFSHTPEFEYTDPNVNKTERGRAVIRGTYWRR